MSETPEAGDGAHFLQTVNRSFDRAARLSDHPGGLLEQIKACNNTLSLSFPLERDKELRGAEVLVLPDVYLNAGGVTASYFEWVKNLTHLRFGRMEKRFQEASARRMMDAVEGLTDRTFTREARVRAAEGASEEDLVRSGLEETLVGAYHELRDAAREHDTDLRTAGFLVAIDKIATIYMDRGIFP